MANLLIRKTLLSSIIIKQAISQLLTAHHGTIPSFREMRNLCIFRFLYHGGYSADIDHLIHG